MLWNMLLILSLTLSSTSGCSGRLMMSFDRLVRGNAAAESKGQNELKQVTEYVHLSVWYMGV